MKRSAYLAAMLLISSAQAQNAFAQNAFAQNAFAQNALQWQPLGEPGGGGAIVSVRVDPRDSKHIVSTGDMLGVATSFDGGGSWQPTFGFTSYEMADVTFHPTNAKEVWVGSCTGPYKSVDGGIHFVSKRQGMPALEAWRYTSIIEKVLFDPANPSRMLAFGGTSRRWNEADTFGWIWESVDGGEIWKHIGTIASDGFSTDAKKGANIVWAAYAPGKNTLHLLIDGGGWFVSDDNGRTWKKQEPKGLPTGINSIALHPKNPNVIWATTSSYTTGNSDETRQTGGIYKSTDGGKTFVESDDGIKKVNAKSNGNLSSGFNNVVLSAANPDVLYTNDHAWNSATIYKSSDGGAHWMPVASRGGIGIENEQKSPVFNPKTATFAGISMKGTPDPQSADCTYWYNTEFILRSRDGGKTWDDATAYQPDPKQPDNWRGRGWVGWCATNFAWNPYRAGQSVLQGMDGARGWVSDDNLQSWHYAMGQTNPWLGGQDVTFTKDGHIFISTGQFGDNNGIQRSADWGKTWTTIEGEKHGLPKASWGSKSEYAGIYAHSDNSKLVWAVSGGNILHSTDAGETWSVVSDKLGASYIAPDPTKAGRFYVSAKDGIYVTDDGQNFAFVGGPHPAGRGRINCDAQGRVLYCQWRDGRTGVWRYTPTAKQWQRLLDEPLAFECVADPTDATRLLMVTNMDPFNDLAGGNGVWMSADDGQSWSQQDAGLAMRRGQAVAFNPHNPEQIVVGTFGRGYFLANWPKTLKPAGTRRYSAVPEDEIATKPTVPSPAPAEITHVIRDFGPAGFDYPYGGWKAENLQGGDGFVTIDANEAGGAGIVLNGADIAPQKQTHLALRARLLPGNGATKLNINLVGSDKTVTFDLSKLNANEFTTLLEPLPDGKYNSIQQLQVQGTNWSVAALPLKIQIDSIGTTSADEKANAAAKIALANDPTTGPPAKDKPSVAGWGFYPQFPQAWMQTHNGFVQRTKDGAAKKDINVVFFGDSIMQGWGGEGKEVWGKNFAPLGAVNYGIGGDSTRQVLYRIQNGEVDGLNPKLVVLKIGTNNLYNDFNAGSDEEIADGISKIVQTLREKLPNTKILLLGILPRQNDYFSGRAKYINEIIKKLDDAKTVRFLDMSDKFQTELGKVKPELYVGDQLHLAKPGYELWAATMKPLFDEMMK